MKRPTSVICGALIGVLLGALALEAEAPLLWGELEAGPYDVGFDRIWELDRSRVWPRSPALDSVEGNVARPIRVDVWYPAECGDSEPMPLEGYVEMEPPAPAFEDLVFLTRRWDEYSYHGLAGEDVTYERLMSAETAACTEAPAASGRFPLVLYSAGWFNRAPDNIILAEFLASHGFVVASVPQLNPGLWTFDFGSDPRSVENQVRDLEVALGAVIEKPFADRRRIAAMGYSTGGDVVLLLAARNPLIDAVVGLDASWTLGPENDVEESPLFSPEDLDVPILAARRPTAKGGGADAVLDSLVAAPRVVVEIPGADHGAFSDDPAQSRLLGTASSPESEAARMAVARTVLEFLRATVGGESSFRGIELAGRLEGRGLAAAFRPASVKDRDDESEE